MSKEIKKHDNPMALLLKDLSQFQKNMIGAKKDSENPFHKSSYADLSSVVNAIKEASNDLNLGYYHKIHDSSLETFLFYSDGINYAEIGSILPIDITGAKNPMQAKGSAITYAKRYTLQGLYGLPSEDDDANECQNTTIQKVNNKTDLKVFNEENLEKSKPLLIKYISEGMDSKKVVNMLIDKGKNHYIFDENAKKMIFDFCEMIKPPM